MQRVAARELPETLRLARPGAMVAFGKRDVVTHGYADAVLAARAGGYEAIERLAGGRAAVFCEETIALAHALADDDPRAGVSARFEVVAALLASALQSLGLDARVGEVPGEYCPGAHSVNIGGTRKVVGVGQRIVAGGAHVGAVVVVDRPDRVRDILVPVYAALGLEWDPATAGSVADGAPGATWSATADAILAAYRTRYELRPAQLDDDTLALARRLAPEHLSPPATEP